MIQITWERAFGGHCEPETAVLNAGIDTPSMFLAELISIQEWGTTVWHYSVRILDRKEV